MLCYTASGVRSRSTFRLFFFSAFNVMVTSTRSSLPWMPYTWMSEIDLPQTPRGWFWGTHLWAISAALLEGSVSRIAKMCWCLVRFATGTLSWDLHANSFWDGYSVCNGQFWGERWWSVCIVAADEVRPGLRCILQSCCGRWLSFYYGCKLWLLCRTDVMGAAPFPFLLLRADLLCHFP